MVENFFCSRIMNSLLKTAFLSLPTLKTFEEKKNQKKKYRFDRLFSFFSCISLVLFSFSLPLSLSLFLLLFSPLLFFFSLAHGRFVQPLFFHPSLYRLVSSFIFLYLSISLFLSIYLSFSKSYVI